MGNEAEGVENVPNHGLTVDRHYQRSARLAIAEDGTGARVFRVPQIERDVPVIETAGGGENVHALCLRLTDKLGL